MSFSKIVYTKALCAWENKLYAEAFKYINQAIDTPGCPLTYKITKLNWLCELGYTRQLIQFAAHLYKDYKEQCFADLVSYYATLLDGPSDIGSHKMRCRIADSYFHSFEKKYGILHSRCLGVKHKVIWQCWLQGLDKAPSLVQNCLTSVEKHCPDFEIRRVTLDNIHHYTSLPGFIYDKFHKGMIGGAHFSDIVRTELLFNHGGIWLDSTVYLSGRIPDIILNEDFFVFNKGYKFGIANWFLSSRPNHSFMYAMKLMLEEYWQENDRAVDYFIFHAFFSSIVENNDEHQRLFLKKPLIDGRIADALQLYSMTNKDQRVFDSITSSYPIHKLSYKINCNFFNN